MENTLCLCMMVKNEGRIIERCLNSVKDIIDTYIISDTGSTDDTIEKIENFFKKYNIKGKIYNHKWVNFGVNRDLLLQVSRNAASYLLLVDADYIINVYDKNFKKYLIHDGYRMKWEGDNDYRNLKLVKGDLIWKYRGPTHEYIYCANGNTNIVNMDSITITEYYDGGNRSTKYQRDIELLTNEIKNNPTDPDIARYYFYLARSYEDLGRYEEAAENYKIRASYGGYDEEIYYSLYKYGVCVKNLNKDFKEISEAFMKAYMYRKTRLEALYEIVKYCADNSLHNLGYIIGKDAINTEYPSNDMLFIDKPIHLYKYKLWYGICAYNSGKYKESIEACEKVLVTNGVPDNVKYLIITNMLYSIKNIEWRKYNTIMLCDQIKTMYKKDQNYGKYYKDIVLFCKNNGIHNVCYYVGKIMLNYTYDENDVTQLKYDMALSSYYLGYYRESHDLYMALLSSGTFSVSYQVIINMLYNIKEIGVSSDDLDIICLKVQLIYENTYDIKMLYDSIFTFCKSNKLAKYYKIMYENLVKNYEIEADNKYISMMEEDIKTLNN